MQSYQEMTKEELCKEKESLEAAYKEWQKRGLSLNMARGKPSEEQLDLTMPDDGCVKQQCGSAQRGWN